MRPEENKASAILTVLSYTPKTLAIDLDTTVAKAKRIINPSGVLHIDELIEIRKIIGIGADLLCGGVVPGKARAAYLERVRRQEAEKAEQQRQREEFNREIAEKQARYAALTPTEKLTADCKSIINAMRGITGDFADTTPTAVLAELQRQLSSDSANDNAPLAATSESVRENGVCTPNITVTSYHGYGAPVNERS